MTSHNSHLITAASAAIVQHLACKLLLHIKLMFGLAGFLVIAVSVGFGVSLGKPSQANVRHARAFSQFEAPPGTASKFEVASIKQDKSSQGMYIIDPARDGRFYARSITVNWLLRIAYGVQGFQIVGGPKWMNSEKFDVQAKASTAVNEEMQKLTPDQDRLLKEHMLEALLHDRFKLAAHRESRQLPVYALVLAKHGPRLQGSNGGIAKGNQTGFGPKGGIEFQPAKERGEESLIANAAPMVILARTLSLPLGRTVVDRTGLHGHYTFTLTWAPSLVPGLMSPGPQGSQAASGMPPAPTSSGPSIFTAIQQQLGLKLDAQKAPVEVLVIDHIEHPSEY